MAKATPPAFSAARRSSTLIRTSLLRVVQVREFGSFFALVQRSVCADHTAKAALEEAASNDKALDFAGSLPDPVHAQLAQKALGDVLPHIAAAAENLDDPVGDPPGHL